MRFAVAHKVATYLVVGFAYLAMVTGGAIAGPVAIAGTLALAGSWWWEPPRISYERWAWLWTAASICALAYSVLTAVVTGDILGVGGEFLIWLAIAKSFNRRAARDYQQLYLLAFLMLVAGSVLNPDLAYGLCFLGFVIAMTWALTLFHLRREMEDNLLVKHAADRASERVEVRRILDSRRIVGTRFFVGTGLLSLVVFLGSAVLFLALPRVGFGFFIKTKGGLTFTGFSDGVRLGGHGVLKYDSTVVMRVEIDPALGGRDAPEIHWRGVAFDHYAHGRWSRSRGAPPTRQIIDRPNEGTERHIVRWQDDPLVPADRLEQRLVRQDVWLEPFDTDVLFGGGLPRVFELASALHRSRKILKNDDVRVDHPSTIHYTVWSELDPPGPAELRRAHGPLPPGYEAAYLQLPADEITARTYALARKITAGAPTEYDKAVAIQRWLDANLTYTLELADPGRQEPVDFFLFDRRKGHCEYFASAFAILARGAGIPTRQVNGFLGGEWNEYEHYVAVRAGDAHSWDEVYFPGEGWVTFDATPSGHEPLGRGGTGWTARMSRFFDTLRFQWTKWVIEYDLVSQMSLFKNLGHGLSHGARAIRDAIVDHWRYGALAAAALLALRLLRRRRRRDALAGPRASARIRTRSPIARTYDRTARRLSRAGFPQDAAATPREAAAGATGRFAAAAPALRELVELYYTAEWGGRADPAAERRAGELADAIGETLAHLPR